MSVFTTIKNTWLRESKKGTEVFDYRAMRLLMGIVALSLPFVVTYLAGADANLESISESYYTAARDAFVGMLFMVATFLWAYNGHFFYEGVASKFASLAAFGVALAPTKCLSTGTDVVCNNPLVSAFPAVHGGSALVLFLILAFFCLFPFRKQAAELHTPQANRRKRVYIVCGCVMLVSIALITAKHTGWISVPRIVFFAEAAALSAFGVAWIVSGKALAIFASAEEKLTFGSKK